MLLVQLTEIPQTADPGANQQMLEKSWMNPKSQYRHRMFESLRGYKEAFHQPQVISVLMEHLADCLTVEEKNQKHEQMIELIIVLFKQILQIPEPKLSESNTAYANKELQKNLLLVFSSESVLDSFNFLS